MKCQVIEGGLMLSLSSKRAQKTKEETTDQPDKSCVWQDLFLSFSSGKLSDIGNAVDTVYLYFSKTFHKVPHDLISKLSRCELDRTVR